MKRLIISLSIILCTSYYTFAQITYSSSSNMAAQRPAKTLDVSAMQVIYQASSLSDTLNPERIAKDTMILQIGQNRISKYFPDTRIRDSILRARLERQMSAAMVQGGSVSIVSAGATPGGPAGSGNQSIIFKNWPAGSITVTDRVMMDIYSYTESSNEIQWHILPDTDTVLTYLCQKAITTFRGRNYEAWFAPDIPINEGPWKFCGLPGLILKVYDTRQHYVFECIGLEQTKAPIEYADMDYLKTNRRDLARIQRRYYDDPMAAMDNIRSSTPVPAGGNVQRVMRAVNADGTEMDMNEMRNRLRNRGYNPIELDV